jgi:septal ring factor EnvC (AmiA/AmiB activator)
MMPIDVLVVALVGGTVLLLLVLREVRRPVEPDVSPPVATDSALEAEQKRLADLKEELAAAEMRTAERERQISVKLREVTEAERERSEAAAELAKQEAALARRERNLERSLADAARSATEAAARIEAREAVLATQRAGLQRQEGEPAARLRSVGERELDVSLDKKESDLAQHVGRPQTQLDRLESDWWEKQLGRPLSAKK